MLVGVAEQNATTCFVMLVFVWQTQQADGQSPRSQICYDLDQYREADVRMALMEKKAVEGLRPVDQQISMFHAGILAALPP